MKRSRGPADPWASERAYCRYDRVLRFPASCPSLLSRDVGALEFYGIKRRLYPATTRNDLFHVDLQLSGAPGHSYTEKEWWSRRYSPANIDVVGILDTVLNVSTIVRSAGGLTSEQSVGNFGAPIARAFDAATTVGGPSGLVVSGALAVVLEVERDDDVAAIWGGEWRVKWGAEWRHEWQLIERLRLAARTIVFHGRAINVFLVVHPKSVYKPARTLRIHLLRLHAERELLRRIARLLAAERFLDGCEHSQVERVQYALSQCLGSLTRARSHGFSTPELAAAFVADRTLSGAELEVLMERVQAFRPVIGRRLQQLRELDDATEDKWRGFLERNPKARNFIYIGQVRVAQYDQRNSQIGAVGDHASASNFSFAGQLNLGAMSAVDTEALVSALRTLRKHLADQLITDNVIEVASEEISPTQIGNAIGALSEAEEAIAKKDQTGAQSALQRSGRWLASFAQSVGIEIAAAAIRAALHLP